MKYANKKKLDVFVGSPTKIIESYWNFIKDEMSQEEGFLKSFVVGGGLDFVNYLKEMNLPYISAWAKKRVDEKKIEKLVLEHQDRMLAEAIIRSRHPEWYREQ